ncbi:unnamed protein product, partial [Trichobilharzia szidati]
KACAVVKIYINRNLPTFSYSRPCNIVTDKIEIFTFKMKKVILKKAIWIIQLPASHLKLVQPYERLHI